MGNSIPKACTLQWYQAYNFLYQYKHKHWFLYGQVQIYNTAL